MQELNMIQAAVDEAAKNGDTVIGEQKVTKNDNWEYTFEVAKYDEKADRIVYTADEKTVPTFYKKTISGTTVTNTFYVPEDKVDVTIKKVWEDNNNEAGKRPDSITLQIKNEDTVIDEPLKPVSPLVPCLA